MASSWVLKIPRSDDDQSHVLIQVSHKDGHPELDLTVFATESEAVYKTKCANFNSVLQSSWFLILNFLRLVLAMPS